LPAWIVIGWIFLGSGTVSNLRDVVCVNDTSFIFQKFLSESFGQTNPSKVLASISSFELLLHILPLASSPSF
jgi:hypothetical protein